MNSTAREKYEAWLASPVISEDDKKKLAGFSESEIEEGFSSELEFGTGGLRGILGLGSSRMNRYNVRRSSAGFASYILEKFGEDAKRMGVAVAYDPRHDSDVFAKETALTFASCGIKAFLFDRISATPLLSFTVRRLGCAGGVVVTASHNQKIYNGYKAYDETGCQLGEIDAASVIDHISRIALEDVHPMPEDEALKAGLLEYLGEDAFEAYRSRILSESSGSVPAAAKEALKIVYTPLHGAGAVLLPEVFRRCGFTDFHPVEAQMKADPEFSTVVYPNPEETSALKLALEQAEKINADVVIATDPDSDRTGFAARDKSGKMVVFTGNQIGAMLLSYLLEKRADNMPRKGYLITTLVSGEMGPVIARSAGLEVRLTLTGFKNIGAVMTALEKNEPGSVILGYEESYGYLPADHARDKDGVISNMLLCEMAAKLKAEGKTVPEYLNGLFERYGFFFDMSTSYTLPGADGAKAIKAVSAKARELGTSLMPGIVKTEDYINGLGDILPQDLMRFYFEDGSWIACRPSGTEPKIKFYYSVKGSSQQECEVLYKQRRAVIDALVESIKQ